MYLLPRPQELSIQESFNIIRYDTNIIIDESCSMNINKYAKILKEDILKTLGFSLMINKGEKTAESIFLAVDKSLKNQEYKLKIDKDYIIIYGGSNAAVLYGVQTLRQILSQKGAVLPCLTIRDYPDIENRGFYHDVTRGRIPTLNYLKDFADKLSYYKLNQLQLYIEHSYLFKDFSEVWRDDTPLTAEEIMELDEYCRDLNIELVPSLASFGHLYKVLSTKSYAHLCELPDSDKKQFGFVDRMEHHTIDASNEQSFEFIKKMLNEFIPLFSSKHFNLCSDETFDLGKGRSKELADEIGIKNMYIGFLNQLCKFVISKGKIPMFWGDIISKFPEAIKDLPEESICLNWGYAPDQREDEAKALAEAGATQYVCPGVGGWNHFINLIKSSYRNISLMCDYGRKYNAIGVLNTDWGDFGHINHPEFSTTGMIYGAAFSWNRESIEFEEINKQISVLEYRDQKEEFVSVIAEMATLSEFTWEAVVRYMEMNNSGKSEEKIKEYFLNIDLSAVNESNEILENKVQDLYKIINTMDTSTRHLVKPYLLAAKGISLMNTIAATIAKLVYKEDNIAVNPGELAVELEYWFYQYKELWRSVSKESELYRIQNVIFWYADFLRELS